MEVIPAINCSDAGCFKRRFSQVKDLDSEWVHIDISDGKFARVRTWNEPEGLMAELQNSGIARLKVEVHLMVIDPLKYLKSWVGVGVARLIFHVEVIDREIVREVLESVPPGVHVGLAVKPETEFSDVEPYLDDVSFVQFLAVEPGFSGQKFQGGVLEKIKELRKCYGNVTIEVDGGIDLNTAKLVKAAGAQVIVSASYLWDSVDPKGAYESLRML